MFDEGRRHQQLNFTKFGCENHYQRTFFKSFDSFSDFKSNIKAIVVKPLVDASLSLHCLLNCLISVSAGLLNMTMGALTFDQADIKKGWDNVKEGVNNLMYAIYHAVSIVIDILDSITRLLTHSIGTIGAGIGKLVDNSKSNNYDELDRVNSGMNP